MESLIEKLKPRNLADSSIANYTRHIQYLAERFTEEKTYTNNEFLTKRRGAILEHLLKLQPSSRRGHLAAICVALNPAKDLNKIDIADRSVYDLYRPMVWKLNEETIKEKKTQQLSDKEKANWCEWSELTGIRDQYLEILKKQKYKQISAPESPDLELVKKALVASLYTYNPPRRLEYAEMRRIKQVDYRKLNKDVRERNNFIVSVNKYKQKYFSFAKVKSRDPDEPLVKIDVHPDLNKVINQWYAITPESESFLINAKGNPMTKNNLSKFLDIKVFKPTGKKISCGMLRHIYLSDMYSQDKSIVFKEALAKKMNHSVTTMETVYVKKPSTPPTTPTPSPTIQLKIKEKQQGYLMKFD